MNKTPLSAQVRRRRPYLGLDYFREQDATLFFERNDDSRRCAETLMGFGVKILILQGSSGAGKSSFLRAGLVPYLKTEENRPVYFLNGGDDDVIRCTSDPMKWIGHAVFETSRKQIAAVAQIADGDADADAADDTAAPWAPPVDDAIFSVPRKALAEVVLDTLECLCNEVPGQLMLVLDQAEEVLTQRDSDLSNDSTEAFFYFLSEMYIRNIDVRIVVALRTEYYGRFRDELDIRDDRLSNRPRHGGVAPYLLRPIRDRDALIRIATAPARGEAARIYNYEFDPVVAGRIVDDILRLERHGSVTPLLQAVCAVLYDDLGENDRHIRLAQYESLGAIPGITNRYVRAGFRDALGESDKKTLARWYHLLFSLVSRQGGGTLVSEIETVDELRTRAEKLQISADVAAVLHKLSTSSWPLLRGLPPDRPTQFSLKHDILAGFFYRWKVAEDAMLAQQKAEEERLRKVEQANAAARTTIVLLILLAAAVILAGLAAWNSHDRFKIQIDDRLALAAEPPRSDYALSLQALLTAHDAIVARGTLPFGFPTRRLRQQTTAALGQALLRIPWFDGKYLAVGMSPEGDRALLLGEDGKIDELPLSPQAGSPALSKTPSRSLPPEAIRPRLISNVAAGYLEGLGPSALIEGQLYYWSGDAPAASMKIQAKLPPSLQRLRPLRYEFVGGALLVTGTKQGPEGDSEIYRLRMTAGDILNDRIRLQTPELVARTGRIAPAPVFAEAADLADTMAYISPPPGAWTGGGHRPAANGRAGTYAVGVARIGSGSLLDLPLPEKPAQRGSTIPFSPAFVLNDRAVLVSGPSGNVYWSPLPAVAGVGRRAKGPGLGTISIAALPADRTTLLPAHAYSPWGYPPLAAVQLPDKKLRFAWLSDAGVWVADGKPVLNRSVNATAVPGIPGALLVGEPGGSRLRFSRTGDFLLLQQQPQYGAATRLRVWNLSPRRSAAIAKYSDGQLVETACAALERSPQGLKGSAAFRLFRLPGVPKEPC
jgi:hypothetical protein